MSCRARFNRATFDRSSKEEFYIFCSVTLPNNWTEQSKIDKYVGVMALHIFILIENDSYQHLLWPKRLQNVWTVRVLAFHFQFFLNSTWKWLVINFISCFAIIFRKKLKLIYENSCNWFLMVIFSNWGLFRNNWLLKILLVKVRMKWEKLKI
jgi:hypothetical protein